MSGSKFFKTSLHQFEISNETKSKIEKKPWNFSVRPGGWLLAERQGDFCTLERMRMMFHEGKGQFSIHVNGASFKGEILNPTRGREAPSFDESILIAQFPGKVRKMSVHTGDQVQKGEALVYIEAMKMEFVIQAPFAGIVKTIFVKEGSPLMPGDRYLDLVPLFLTQKGEPVKHG
jgi:biotin carboxyl carrier protein